MEDSEELYDLELARYKTGFVEGLKRRMEEGGADKCYGFVLGTRKGDPNCGVQTSFTPSRSVPFGDELGRLCRARQVFSPSERKTVCFLELVWE